MTEYSINGKDADITRLKNLAATYNAHSLALLKQAGLRENMRYLELGCGIGVLTLQVATELLGGSGHACGIDIHPTRLQAARDMAAAAACSNIEFVQQDLRQTPLSTGWDVVYIRSLLCHLPDPVQLLKKAKTALHPEGKIVIEEPDFSGVVHYPEDAYIQAGDALLRQNIALQGGDLNIGHKLPTLLREAGFELQHIGIAQQIFMSGDKKCTQHTVLQNMEETLLENNLVTRERLAEIVAGMEAFIQNPNNLITRPRVFQVIGCPRTSN